MKRWLVEAQVQRVSTIEVEAENEEGALEVARTYMDGGYSQGFIFETEEARDVTLQVGDPLD